MSEVGDAVQVIMLCGRGAMLIGKIPLKLAMQVVKLLNTIYLAKWKGSVSLNRLRQIKGDDFVFINVSSENEEDLFSIENEMKSHGILYARMPDLCGGDARTQYAIASSDAVKMKAMLLDHTAGPNRHIRVGPISETDYMMTGKKADGTDTKEMEALNRSAQEEMRTAPGNFQQKAEPSIQAAAPDKKRAIIKPIRRSETGPGKDTPSQRNAPVQSPARPGVSLEETMIQSMVSDIRIRSQDYQRQYGADSVFWIKQKPLYENRQFAQFLLPDGKNTIFIHQADILPGRDAQTGMRLAAVFTDQRYSMMNLEKMNVIAADGSKAIAMFKLPGGEVVAHGSQQPDRRRTGSDVSVKPERKDTGPKVGKEVKRPEKKKSR